MVSKIGTALSYINGAMAVYKHGRNVYDWYIDRKTYQASIADDAYIFGAVLEWLDEQVVNSKSFKFVSKFDSVTRYFNESGTNTVLIGGYPVSVTLDTTTGSGNADDIVDSYMAVKSSSLLFTCQSIKGIEAVEQLLVDLTNKANKQSRKIGVHTLASYGWESNRMPKRSIESVFLPEGAKEELFQDIQEFLGSEDRYGHIGIPWHRGYMFHGAPGNGKSSLVTAIANELKLNLYNLSLSGINSDRHLTETISRVNDNSMLLIEDIDIFSSSKSRNTDGSKGPTLHGLLNSLDGVSTPHGLLTFITTNHSETLDPALIRPGRVDYRLELRAPVRYQIDNMYAHVYDQVLGVEPREFTSMAELTNIFKTNPDDPEAARLMIKQEETE